MGSFFGLAGTASINDVFFVHERGTRVGLWNLAVISSVNVAPVISGYVIVDLGWRWSFWILAISFGVLLVLILFCFPETTFYRNNLEGVSQPVSNSPSSGAFSDDSSEKRAGKDLDPEPTVEIPQTDLSYVQASKWKKLLGVQSVKFGRYTQIFAVCIRPLGLMRHPAIVWGCVMWSVTFTWAIILGATASQIFAAPPYNLTPTQVGNLVGIAPLIGSTLGTLFGGWFCDFISKQLAIRNNGIYEPEFRLWVMIPFLLTLIAGSFGLGLAISAQLSAITAGVFLAILNFAIGVGCTGIVVYQNDACQQRAGEAFGLGMVK
jgi:MFS family permease